MLTRVNNQKGSAIWVTLGVAIVCAIAAYGALFAAQSAARRTQFYQERTRAHYAAEAGYVWATEQLWVNQRWPTPAGTGGGTQATNVNGIAVNITMDNCPLPLPDCGSRQMRVTVSN